MSFFIFFIITVLLFLIFKRYRSVNSVTLVIVFILAMPTAALVYGLVASNSGSFIFFTQKIRLQELYFMLAAWYAIGIVCSVKIIRTYIEYRKINIPQ